MAGCGPQRFTGIGAAELACLKAKGAAAGVPISGDDGQATTMGVTVRWHYDEAARALVVECVDAPFFVPCSTITDRIKHLVESCMMQNG